MTWGCGCRFCFICRRTICCFRSSMSELSSGRAAAAFSPQGLVKWKRVSPIPEGYCLTSSVYRSTVLLKINNSPEISRVTGSSCSVGSNVTVVCAINLHPGSTTIRFVLSIWTSTHTLSVTRWTEHKYHTINTPEWPNSHNLTTQDGGYRHLQFRKKMSINPDWIKIYAPNFMGRSITGMRRWPRDQKSKPEVNLRDVIS